MLKGLDPLLTPELLMHLCAMGHGEWVAVVDANFTARHLAGSKPLVRLPGIPLLRAAQAVLSVFPLDAQLAQPVGFMHHSGQSADFRTPAQQALIAHLRDQGLAAETAVEPIERFAFYERVRQASLLVQCGEATAYGNALFCKGVIL